MLFSHSSQLSGGLSSTLFKVLLYCERIPIFNIMYFLVSKDGTLLEFAVSCPLQQEQQLWPTTLKCIEPVGQNSCISMDGTLHFESDALIIAQNSLHYYVELWEKYNWRRYIYPGQFISDQEQHLGQIFAETFSQWQHASAWWMGVHNRNGNKDHNEHHETTSANLHISIPRFVFLHECLQYQTMITVQQWSLNLYFTGHVLYFIKLQGVERGRIFTII